MQNIRIPQKSDKKKINHAANLSSYISLPMRQSITEIAEPNTIDTNLTIRILSPNRFNKIAKKFEKNGE